MEMMPRQPRARIVLAVVMTGAIGGLFLAGGQGDDPGLRVSSAPAESVVAPQSPPNLAAPIAQVAVPSTGRDPFAPAGHKHGKPGGGSSPGSSLFSPTGSSAGQGGSYPSSVVSSAAAGAGAPAAPAVPKPSVDRDVPIARPLPVPTPEVPNVSPTPPPSTSPGDLSGTPDASHPGRKPKKNGNHKHDKPGKHKHGKAATQGAEAYRASDKKKKQQARPKNPGQHKGWAHAKGRKGRAASRRHGRGYAYGWWWKAPDCDSHSRSSRAQSGCRR
jgi:hypothetical protein